MHLKIQIFICFFGLLVNVETGRFSSDPFRERGSLFEEGKRQFEVISEKSKLPHYGSCWKNAVSYLEVGCKYLSEELQSNLALKFTDCFLQSSGHEPLSCEGGRRECLPKLPDKSFNVYTEFYTHTQNICYFLQNKVWHEETEKTIDKLSSTSIQVSLQLEEAEKIQGLLLDRQKESILVQQELLQNSANLVSALQLSKDQIQLLMSEFKSSTLEQKRMLFEVFDTLSSLKAWVVGEVSWIDSVLFYITTVVVGYMLTSTPRTQSARLFVLLILTANSFVERLILSLILEEDESHKTNVPLIVENLLGWVWLCRKITIAVCLLLILIFACKYSDYNIINNRLLIQIRHQNSEIINYLQKHLHSSKNHITKIESISESPKYQKPPKDSCNNSITIIPLSHKFENTDTDINLKKHNCKTTIALNNTFITHEHTNLIKETQVSNRNTSVLCQKYMHRESLTPSSTVSDLVSVSDEKEGGQNLRRSVRLKR